MLIAAAGLAWAVAPSAPALGDDAIMDGSFESMQEPAPGFYYNPGGFPWAFASTSGVIQPPSAFNGPAAATDGTQYAFVQTNTGDAHSNGSGGVISQSVNLPATGAYVFSTQQASREAPGTSSYAVLVDGVNVGGVQAAPSQAFTPRSFTFSATAGPHTFALQSTGPTDSTTLLDQVSVTPATSATAGAFSTRPFTGDADSGISASKTYTHAVNLNGPAVVVNGVNFAAGANGNNPGQNYDLEGAPNAFPDNSGRNHVTGAAGTLINSFFYGGAAAETLTLSGLTPGKTYIATFYNAGFGGPGTRLENVSDSQGGFFNNFDQNYTGDGNGNLLQDTYTAVGSSITFSFLAQDANADSFHQYGFTNEVAPEPASAGLLALGSLGLLARRRRGGGG